MLMIQYFLLHRLVNRQKSHVHRQEESCNMAIFHNIDQCHFSLKISWRLLIMVDELSEPVHAARTF